MLLKFRIDRNLENLFDIIQHAKGKISLEIENGTRLDLKDQDYQEIMMQKKSSGETFYLHVYHPRDYFDLVYYHMGLNIV